MSILDWFREPDPTHRIEVARGERGRFRWKVIENATGRTVALAPVRGFETAEEAERAARRHLLDSEMDDNVAHAEWRPKPVRK